MKNSNNDKEYIDILKFYIDLATHKGFSNNLSDNINELEQFIIFTRFRTEKDDLFMAGVALGNYITSKSRHSKLESFGDTYENIGRFCRLFNINQSQFMGINYGEN